MTSVADVLAGIAMTGFFLEGFYGGGGWVKSLLLCAATAALYGGGVVFNDVFDAALDKIERPERPIPRGAVGIRQASLLGAILLLAGIGLAFLVNEVAGILAMVIVFLALLYNKFAKHFRFWGPLNMGACRGVNLLLGISILPVALSELYFMALVPVAYIFAITMISQGEVHGGNKKSLYIAAVLYLSVIGFISYFSFVQGYFIQSVTFIILFAWMIYTPLLTAMKMPEGDKIGKAVKAGVIALILMDAAWAASFGSLYAALVIVSLLPVSRWLAKRFAVT